MQVAKQPINTCSVGFTITMRDARNDLQVTAEKDVELFTVESDLCVH
jgi:hypothetical protein